MPAVARPLLVVALLAAASQALAADPAPATAPPDLWGGKRTFEARLSARNQPVVTRSDGEGRARFVLDIATRTMTWEITFSGLTSPPTGIGLHGPAQPGTNGARLIDLAGARPASPVRGSITVPAGQIQYMLLGWTYVLLSTRKHPDGELRGKVDVVPPEQAARPQ